MQKSKALNTATSACSLGDTLYYDGGCPLCSKEIAKLSKADVGGLRCVDLSIADLAVSKDRRGTTDSLNAESDTALNAESEMPSKEQMMRRLHLRTADGRWLVGLRANVYAWRNTPYAKYWRLLELPLVFPLASAAYELWAKVRFDNQQRKTSR